MESRTLRPEAYGLFHELLPWYVNGTLNEQDQLSIDLCLRDYAECRIEHLWLLALKAHLRDNEGSANEGVGLERLLAMVNAKELRQQKPSVFLRLVKPTINQLQKVYRKPSSAS